MKILWEQDALRLEGESDGIWVNNGEERVYLGLTRPTGFTYDRVRGLAHAILAAIGDEPSATTHKDAIPETFIALMRDAYGRLLSPFHRREESALGLDSFISVTSDMSDEGFEVFRRVAKVGPKPVPEREITKE